MKTKDLLKQLNIHAPVQMAQLKAELMKPNTHTPENNKPYCDDCGGTGICGDEGPGMKNARHEWVPCDCSAGQIHKTVPEYIPEYKAERAQLKARILVLEDALNDIFHRTDSTTTTQMEIIQKIQPQDGEIEVPKKALPPKPSISTTTMPVPTPSPAPPSAAKIQEICRKRAFPGESEYEYHLGMNTRDYLASQETLSDLDHPEFKGMRMREFEEMTGHKMPIYRTVEYLVWEAKARAALKYLRADAMIAASQQASLITGGDPAAPVSNI